MKNKFYAVFDIQPVYDITGSGKTVQFEKLDTFETELEAMQFIDKTQVGFQLTILPVWE